MSTRQTRGSRGNARKKHTSSIRILFQSIREYSEYSNACEYCECAYSEYSKVFELFEVFKVFKVFRLFRAFGQKALAKCQNQKQRQYSQYFQCFECSECSSFQSIGGRAHVVSAALACSTGKVADGKDGWDASFREGPSSLFPQLTTLCSTSLASLSSSSKRGPGGFPCLQRQHSPPCCIDFFQNIRQPALG